MDQAPKTDCRMPEELIAAFALNQNAQRVFQALPSSHQHEHIQYVVEAQKSETRARRAERTVENLLLRGVRN